MVKKWNDYEIQLLKNNLNKTYDELTNLLNRSKQSIRGKIRKINYNKEKTLSFNDINWNDIQDYYDNNKKEGYCRVVISPKIDKIVKMFNDRIKNGLS
jgi:fructose/tagatose bisphosphate aldolase